MAPSRDITENALIEAQRALAVVYGSSYPFCNTVKQGLEGILNQRYGGSQEDFTVKFIRPTVVLLNKLSEKGFPIIKNGRVIVHLLAPTNHLESGEMFYQVGHRTPGTLAVKFTKYEGNNVVMQAGTIQENELQMAFRPEYIEKMRNLAKNMGDQLMRIMLILTENSQAVFITEKVEVRKVMSDCHPPVMETGMPKLPGPGDPVQVDEPTTCCCCADQAVRDDQTALIFGHQAKEHDSKETENLPYPPLTQAVGNAPLAPATSRNIDHASVPGSPGVTNPQPEEHSRSNSSYPPLRLAADDNVSHPVTCPSAGERFSGANVTNSKYPPIVQAVKDNPPLVLAADDNVSHPVTCPSAGERLSGTSVTNSEYPPMVQAVKDNPSQPTTRPTAPERSHGTSATNSEYPPIVQAVKDNPSQPTTRPTAPERSHGTSATNSVYLPIVQAVKDKPLQPTTRPTVPEQSHGTSATNSEYPPIVQAVKDKPSQPTTRPTAPERSHGTSATNSEYPPIVQAVKYKPSQPTTRPTCPERSPGTSATNSEYPPMVQAVKDNPSQPTTRPTAPEQSPGTSATNSEYPPIVQAVRDNPLAQAIISAAPEPSSGTSVINSEYSPMWQSVRDSPFEPATSRATEKHLRDTIVRNPDYPPLMEAVRDHSSRGRREHPAYPLTQTVSDTSMSAASEQPAADNPTYPALIQAVGGTVQSVEESSIASAAAGNPAYPPLMQAVKDNPVVSVNGYQSQGNLLSSSSSPTNGEPYMVEEGLDLF